MHAFFVALQFLTRLPSPIRGTVTLDELGCSIGWFPAVGALLGLILVGIDFAASLLFDVRVANTLLVTALVALTGALHLDGVIDTLDGFAAGSTRETQLDAMRETHAGTVGAIAGILTLFSTYAAITALPATVRVPALFIAPFAGRIAILLSYSLYPYARPGPGLSHSLKLGATPGRTSRGIAAAAAMIGATTGLGGLGVLLLVVGWVHLVASISLRRVGGLTGDVIGAICEGSQVITLLTLPLVHFLGGMGAWPLISGGWGPSPSVMAQFIGAIQFLTRLPLPRGSIMAGSQLADSARWFPVVGGLLGAIVGLVDIALSTFAATEIRAVTAVVLLAVLTGALHLDGLMDACDGLLALATSERRLEIMRDSRVGSFAIVGASTLLLTKYSAFLALPADHRLAGFIAIGGLSRWAMVYAASRYPTARQDGLAVQLRAGLNTRSLVVASIFAAALAAPAGVAGAPACVAAWLTTVVLARYTQSKISGLTGDTYGAICEIVEVVVAIALPPLWRITS